MVVSTPVFFEYEDVLHRPNFAHLTARDVDDFLDFIASVCDRCQVNFLWRPLLLDPDDDLILEAAVSGGVDAIVTYNQKDFIGCEQFAVRVISPSDFIKELHL